jgi:hypothetical protein
VANRAVRAGDGAWGVAAGVVSDAERVGCAAVLTLGADLLLVFGSCVGPVAQVVRAHA